jgi:TrmH family RNA methyltransferase
MITIRKLLSLPFKTRLRKVILLLQEQEIALQRAGASPDPGYAASLIALLGREEKLPAELRMRLEEPGTEAEEGAGAAAGDAKVKLVRRLNRTRHLLLAFLHAEPAEWDLVDPGSGTLNPARRRVFPIRLYLEDIRSPFNVGAIFRTAEAFAVREILLSADTPSPLHPRAQKTARGTGALLPWALASLDSLAASGEELFALEVGGTPCSEFRFPARGTLLIGSEELGLSPEALRLTAGSAGRVSIPMAGAKRSLNVSVAFGIVMQAWYRALLEGESH